MSAVPQPQCCAKCDLYVSLVSNLNAPFSAQMNINPNCLETAVQVQSQRCTQIPVDDIRVRTPEVEATVMMENVQIHCRNRNMDTRVLDNMQRESEAACEAERVKDFEARLEAKYRDTGIIPRSRPLLHSPSLKTIVKKPKMTRTGAREYFRRGFQYKTGKFRPLPLALSAFPPAQDEDTFVLNTHNRYDCL